MTFNPSEDSQFEKLARTLAPSRRTRIAKAVRGEEYMSLEDDPFGLPVEFIEHKDDEDEYEDSLFIRDFLKPGPGLAVDYGLAFELVFKDLGEGRVSTVNNRGESGTFTRATTAYTVDRTGLLVQVASGVPRSYYDPTTLAYRGYLAEGARTNLEQRSDDFSNAWWGKNDTTTTADNITAPNGTTTADLLTEGTNGLAFVAGNTHTITSDAAQSVQRFMKRGNHDWVFFNCLDSTSANAVGCYFNLATGAAGTAVNTGTSSAAAGKITAYPNGWYLCEVTGVVGGGFTSARSLTRSASADNSTTRVANGTRYEWGAQHEDNVAFGSTYIPTAGASATRNSDRLTYPTASWLDATQGTTYSVGRVFGLAAATFPGIAAMDGGTSANAIGTSAFNSSGNLSQECYVATVSQVSLTTLVGGSINTRCANAFAWAANNFAGVTNGGTVLTDGAGSIPTVTTVRLGENRGGGNNLFGTVESFRYFSQRLPNAVLQALTV